MAVCLPMLEYLQQLEKDYGNVLNAPLAKQKHLQSLAPKEGYKRFTANTPQYLEELALEIRGSKTTYSVDIRIRPNKVINQKFKKLIENYGLPVTRVAKLLNTQIDKQVNGFNNWELGMLEDLCRLFEIEPKSVLRRNAIQDDGITLPYEWVDYGVLASKLEKVNNRECKKLYRFDKYTKLRKDSRLKLSQLRSVGAPKQLMTKEGYQELEEILSEYRRIEERSSTQSPRNRGHRKRVRL